MITTNSLGQEIKNPENFWKWFGDSITVDEQGRPIVFYHGTRSDFTEFKSNYSDQLIFFSFKKDFADNWGKSHKRFTKELEDEIFEKQRTFERDLFKKYQDKYGEDFYSNDEQRKEYEKETDEHEEQLEKERNVHTRTLGCYIRATKIFVPERDYELVLDEIIKYYDFPTEAPDNSKEIDELRKERDRIYDKIKQDGRVPRDMTDEEEKRLEEIRHEISDLFDEQDAVYYFEVNHLSRIKKGAWIYFEHKPVVDKIWSLGYDAIQLSEAGGEQTTIAVRAGNNQIKSVDNNGNYNSSNNIYESMNENLTKLNFKPEIQIADTIDSLVYFLKQVKGDYRIIIDENSGLNIIMPMDIIHIDGLVYAVDEGWYADYIKSNNWSDIDDYFGTMLVNNKIRNYPIKHT